MMHAENGRLLAAMDAELEAGRPFALATIVGTSGSTYRHAGARLLVTADGGWVGNISGGCLEGEVLEVGRRVLARDRAELVAYDLTADEEALWGWGMGCNGAVEVLVEPVRTAMDVAHALRQVQRTGRPHVLASVLSSAEVPAGEHLLVRADGSARGDLPQGLTEAMVAAARGALSAGDSRRVDIAGADTFLEVVHPPARLVVCGAGHDAVPLLRAAGALGWDLTVVDDRSAFLVPDRFPPGSRLVHAEPARAARAVEVGDGTSVVVMSHNFLRDVDYVGSFLGTACSYLGVLGPARRLERILDELAKVGVRPSEEERARLYGPAGLDLGAEGPDEIAASICAEILAVRRSRSGGFLRDRRGAMHELCPGS